jgi:hypothetical protein
MGVRSAVRQSITTQAARCPVSVVILSATNANDTWNTLQHNHSRSQSEPRKPPGPPNHLRSINPAGTAQAPAAAGDRPRHRRSAGQRPAGIGYGRRLGGGAPAGGRPCTGAIPPIATCYAETSERCRVAHLRCRGLRLWHHGSAHRGVHGATSRAIVSLPSHGVMVCEISSDGPPHVSQKWSGSG